MTQDEKTMLIHHDHSLDMLSTAISTTNTKLDKVIDALTQQNVIAKRQSNMKKYCTLLPDTIQGIFIGTACKLHDNLCGMSGSYNPLTTINPFYLKLRECGLSVAISCLITLV